MFTAVFILEKERGREREREGRKQFNHPRNGKLT